MEDLTCSYRIKKMEVKIEGVTQDGRHVKEVITIGSKPVESECHRRFPKDKIQAMRRN